MSLLPSRRLPSISVEHAARRTLFAFRSWKERQESALKTISTAIAIGIVAATVAGAQQTTPVPNTRAARRGLNVANCRIEFAIVNDVPMKILAPTPPVADSSRPAGLSASVIAANDTVPINCYVTTAFSQPEVNAAFFASQPVVLTSAPAAAASSAPMSFVPGKIIMSSSAGEIALPFKPVPDTGVIKRVTRPPS
jgi:hypothetical protein